MDEVSALLKPHWGAEKWIDEGWQQLTDAERDDIKSRVDTLFKNGLPFEIKKDKSLYLYSFSMLAQLEVLAIQVPIKFEKKLADPELQKKLHVQLVDEVFHGIVFTKIVFLLSAPYASPPAYNDSMEKLCNFIRTEECPKMALMLLNLVAEGWIEEVFASMHKHKIAPEVFSIILADEQRHVSEADLYQAIGLPDKKIAREKLAYIEDKLISGVLTNYKYSTALSLLLGNQGITEFLTILNKKHCHQLSKIDMEPSENWRAFMAISQGLLPNLLHVAQSEEPITMSPIRQVLMTQWQNPSDPTMVGEFNLDISCLDFFDKKHPPETLTTLMMQTVSLGLITHKNFRTYLSHKKLYTADDAYIGLVVKLPGCGDHMGSIVFKNCHKTPMAELVIKIRQAIGLMHFCYQRREQLEKEHPHLATIMEQTLLDINNGIYPYPMPGNAIVSISTIGHQGYTRAKSPLRNNEAMKFTLLEVDRKMVWDKALKQFTEQDILPISISADHRIFDGNLPIPHVTGQCFSQVFATMTNSTNSIEDLKKLDEKQLIKTVEALLHNNLELGYKMLSIMQTLWVDFIDIESLLFSVKMDKMTESAKRFLGDLKKEKM